MPLQAGHKLAHYEVLEPIGRGGMGEVYRAKDSKLGRDVAIKVLPDEFARDEERLRRFQREAKVLASLNHPNIAAIYGLEQSGDTHYLVLELVPGETLAERIARGPIPVEEALEIAKKIAEALEEAHERGIVHRDLKPANIKLTPDDKVKVLDFGLAKAFVEEGSENNTSTSMSPTITRDATRVGVILGTAAYMSPEQAKGKRVDKRADVWAFGAVLYEMLSGIRVFEGEDVSDTLVNVLTKEPDWGVLPSSTPTLVRRLIGKCLTKDPHRRLHDIADARLEAEEASSERSEEDRSFELSRPRRASILVILIAVALSVLAFFGLDRFRSSQRGPVLRTAIVLPEGEALDLDRVPSVAISPDGRHVAYVTNANGSRKLYLRALDQLEAQLVEANGATMPFFSPDSQWLGFGANRELMKVSISGGAPVALSSLGTFDHDYLGSNVRGATWTTDGRIVFSPSASVGLHDVSVVGGDGGILTVPVRAEGEKNHRFPGALPGGRAVVFTVALDDIVSFDDAAIAVLSLDTGQYRIVLEGGTNAHYVDSGHLVYARSGNLVAVPFDLRRLQVSGAPVTVLEGVLTHPGYGSAAFDVSSEGHLLYAPGKPRGDKRQVLLVDREGRSQPLIEQTRDYTTVRFAPDGLSLAVGIGGANDTVWRYDSSRGGLTQLTFSFDNYFPIWTPDASHIVFRSNREGTHNLFWRASDGSGDVEKLTSSEGDKRVGSWDPDGKILLFEESLPDSGANIWMLQMDATRERSVFLRTKFNEARPEFSPDGNFVAYQSDESGRYEVYIRSFPDAGRKRQVSTQGGVDPRWNPDGNELFYRNGDALMVVDVRLEGDVTLSRPQRLFDDPSAGVGDTFDVAPDGNRFAIIEEGESEAAVSRLILIQNWVEELKRLVPTDK